LGLTLPTRSADTADNIPREDREALPLHAADGINRRGRADSAKVNSRRSYRSVARGLRYFVDAQPAACHKMNGPSAAETLGRYARFNARLGRESPE
jgi:hypothetical protein